MSDTQRNLQIFRDNAKNKSNELRRLYEDKNKLSTKPDLKKDRLRHDSEKAQRLVEKYEDEFLKTQSVFEKAQREQTDAQDKVTRARELTHKLQTKLQEESKKTQNDLKKENDKIDNKISRVADEQKAWEAKAVNEERNLRLEFERSKPANDNHAPSGRTSRGQIYR